MENELYSNTKYSFERDGSKTIVINHIMDTTNKAFDVVLPENLIVDKHADVYLDSLTTFYCKTSKGVSNNMGFILSIDQFDI